MPYLTITVEQYESKLMDVVVLKRIGVLGTYQSDPSSIPRTGDVIKWEDPENRDTYGNYKIAQVMWVKDLSKEGYIAVVLKVVKT